MENRFVRGAAGMCPKAQWAAASLASFVPRGKCGLSGRAVRAA